MSSTVGQVSEQASKYSEILALLGVLTVGLWLLASKRHASDEPPALSDTIPFLSNAYQYMTDLQSFTKRVSKSIQPTNIIQFHLGPVRVYLVAGAKNVEAMFRKSTSISGDKFVLMVIQNLQKFTPEDVQKFKNDKSGRLPKAAPGWENTPSDQRFFAILHSQAHEYLLRSEATVHLANVYERAFGAALEKQPSGEWTTVHMYEFLQRDMGTSAAITMAGERCLQVCPDFMEQFWKFDSIALQVVYGLPRWMNPKATRIRDDMNLMAQKFLGDAFSSFDWDGPSADAEWEPTFGSRFMRKQAKWFKDGGFSLQSRAGLVILALFAINSNTIPITGWIMFELIKDPSLFKVVRTEAQTAMRIDPETGMRSFDGEKLVSLPLLHSIFTESLRLNVSINITREVVEPTMLNGYRLRKGALLQAPTNLMHYDEQIWSRDGHAASEFWAERHLKEVKKVDDATGTIKTVKAFALAARPSEFFPFGGGGPMCPGRFFAKREVLLTVAMLVCRFDMEFVDWTNMDGSVSDRPPLPNQKYFGSTAVPPDRDVRLRWKRLW